MRFFVAGTTGQVGGATARHLLQQGHEVQTLARRPEKAAALAAEGVEVRQGDLSDTAALASALQGVDGAFLLVPPMLLVSPDFRETTTMLDGYAAALRQSPPARLALLSSFGSEHSSGIGLIRSTYLMEQALGDLPLPTAFVRGGSFLENNLGSLEAAATTGVLYTFLTPTDRPVPHTATEDLGAEVVRLLVGGWSGKKVVEVGTAISADDVAHGMGEALGRPVQAQAVPRERWAATMEGFGLPAGRTGLYEEMMDGVNSGWIHFGTPGAEHVPGTTTPAEVYRKALR